MDCVAANLSASPSFVRSHRVDLIALAAIAAGLLLIYLPGIHNGLVFDDSYLTEGLFNEYASPLQLHARMFSYGSFVWVHALFGDGWWKQRIVNLVIHFGVVVALWALYKEILRHIVPGAAEGEAVPAPYHESPALAVALGFFALNPVAVYAVGYLIERSILLATFFVVAGLWLFARGLARKRPLFHALALACYVLAVMSKEHAILAPLAAIPVYIVIARPDRKRLAFLALGGALLVALAGAALWARYGDIIGKPFDEYSHVYLAQLAKLDPDAEKHAYGLSILNQAWLFFRYGVDWLVPYAGWMSINLRPPFPVQWLTFPQVLGIFGYAAVVIGGFFLVLRYRDGRALLGLSLLFPALLFATEFATVWVQDPFVLYRSYIWAIGVPGLVFYVVHGPSPKVLLGIGMALAALFAWQAIDRVLSLATPESAWTDAIEKLPNDPRAVGRWFPYLNRGSAYVDDNRFDLAMRDFEASSALGDLGMGVFNMGSLLSAAGKQEEALAAFDRAQNEGYNLYNLPFQRALALLKLGRVDEAYRQFQATLAANPASPTREIALLHVGRVGLQLGKRDEAQAALEKLLAADPGNKEGRYLLGMAYVMKGDGAQARQVLDPLVREAPTGPAYYARAMANYQLHRKAEAELDIDNALRYAPDNANLRAWQAKIRAMP